MERKIIILLTLVLIAVGVTGCAKPKINTVPTEMDTIGNLEAVSTVLGCREERTRQHRGQVDDQVYL